MNLPRILIHFLNSSIPTYYCKTMAIVKIDLNLDTSQKLEFTSDIPAVEIAAGSMFL